MSAKAHFGPPPEQVQASANARTPSHILQITELAQRTANPSSVLHIYFQGHLLLTGESKITTKIAIRKGKHKEQ